MNYCISNEQKKEYDKILNKEVKLLQKGGNFTNQPIYSANNDQSVLTITYVGSILYGRWKTLGLLSRLISEMKNIDIRYELNIFSQFEPSKEEKMYMEYKGASSFKGKLDNKEVFSVLKDSDIVLHVESFEEKEKFATRLSFSTKIVDLLSCGRSIMAIGWEEAASIKYLKNNDAALVACNEYEIREILKRVAENRSVLAEYSNKSWECGVKNHQIEKIQNSLYNDLNNLIEIDR